MPDPPVNNINPCQNNTIETLDMIEEQDYSNVFDERALPHNTVDQTHALPMADKLAKCVERNKILCEKKKKWSFQ